MSTTETDLSGFMRKRALFTAKVYLTRRKGAVVEDTETDAGVNLVVTLPPTRKKSGLRQLGVTLRYVMEPVTSEQANKVLRPSWPVPDYGPFPFPVALFFFTMRDDGAWYSWIAEPVVSTDGKAQLALRSEPDCHPLTDESLEELLNRVDGWYDAHYAGLAAAVPTGKRGKKS